MRLLVIGLCALALLGLAACGGDDEAATTSETTDVNPTSESTEVSAVPSGEFAFEQDSLESKPGELSVTFDNPAPIAHDFCLEDSGGKELGCTDLIADGDTDVTQYAVEPGEYTYFCSVAGHREGGMEGTLTVD